ncbi:MAG TPA: hypothetical protein PK402_03410, partial [Tepidisphaeraceae bacterium]|nr:hypothetical protein [Tepidisphaeraceae bacterium]
MSTIEIDLYEPKPRWRTNWPIVSILIVALCYLVAGYDPVVRQSWHSIASTEMTRMTNTLEQGTKLRQIGYLALGCWGIATLVLRRSTRVLRPTWPVLYCMAIYAVWAMLSIAWSPDKSLTAKRLVVFGWILFRSPDLGVVS